MATQLYNQPTAAPTEKVHAVGVAGAVSVLLPFLVAVLAYFGVIVPDDLQAQVVAALAALITVYSSVQAVVQFAAGYMKKSKK